MKEYSREEISRLILDKIASEKEALNANFDKSKNNIGYFIIDDLLPIEIAAKCFENFPKKADMRHLKSLREDKFVSAQMDKHATILEDVLYAFQDKTIVKVIGEICEIKSLSADESLYAGGISLMTKGNFLHPHLDNSHDSERNQWRILNLLYYVTPNWETENGGNLEIWPNGPKKDPTEIQSKFNRLVVMETHGQSWHSVNMVNVEKSRCCISNYYFSDKPVRDEDQFHVTTFRGRPSNSILDLILKADSEARMLIRKIFKKGVRKNPHIYEKDKK
ncbi:Proline 4-hydroxylase (includes Rps23 Pro-64 3,4-dihydroxylase Tpa1), contains SM-20 domain [Flavobacteriaceae bacterium MAR_2010_188]|nr:Proline 4-hydroxylase (includes Rps23 Pro-64 3,4-dihydroxylase Tpa1), contains SM-20 domain [Flavobacteriaceae bacterium MAR_2010_188]